MPISKYIRKKIFEVGERTRRFLHFQLAGIRGIHASKIRKIDISKYYKQYDEIYTLADEPEFVAMYRSRQVVHEDFFDLRRRELIPHGGKLLDLGCGDGGNAIYFANLGYDAHGVDVSEHGIKIARDNATKHDSSAIFEIADILDMASPKEKYDICTDVGCLHMLVLGRHRKKYLEVAKNYLKHEGIFYLFQGATERDQVVADEEEYVAKSMAFEYHRMLNSGKIVKHRGCGGMQISLKQYLSELEASGFKILHAKLVTTQNKLYASLLATPR